MGNRIAGDVCGIHGRLRVICGECANRAERRERTGLDVWRDWLRVHDIRGAAGGAQTGARLANWARAGVDARALVAGLVELAGDSVSWWISFWRDANERLDVAADCYRRERRTR